MSVIARYKADRTEKIGVRLLLIGMENKDKNIILDIPYSHEEIIGEGDMITVVLKKKRRKRCITQ